MYCLGVLKSVGLKINVIGRKYLHTDTQNSVYICKILMGIFVARRELCGWLPHCLRSGEDDFGLEAVSL